MDVWDIATDTVRTCLAAGVKEFVVCAGARNAALLEALAQAESQQRVKLWRHFEERCAGFFALGRTIATNEPCAVVTTSGTAAAELLPAVIEAHYQQRPLVAITADRPARFRGTGAPQAIEQEHLFGPYAATADWNGNGPWHLNVELEEEFTPASAGFPAAAAYAPARERLDVSGLARFLRNDIFRGLAVIIGGLDPAECEEVFHFCLQLGAPVLAEATSGLREALQELALPDGDRMLKEQLPGKILRIGDVPSGRFWRDLEDLPEVNVWSITRSGFSGLARESQVTRGPIDRVIQALGEIDAIGDVLDVFAGTSRRTALIEECLEAYPDSEAGLIRTLSLYASFGDSVYLGNSLPIREWNQFAQWEKPVPDVRANRGANGIDGQLSTWLGITANRKDAWAVVGDLTALYDLPAPMMLGQTMNHGRVLAVINNGGGKIFERLPRLDALSPRAAECLINPQQVDFSAMAALWGMRHLRVTCPDDFDQLEACDGALLLEIVPDDRQTQEFWGKWKVIGERI